MKRFHVHIAVNDLATSTRFYSTLFGMPPTVEKKDYAKWMLDDPRLNFAISERVGAAGLNHLGFQADSDEELEALHTALRIATNEVLAEKGANCCYATSDKYWVKDPTGIPWEQFRTLDSIPFYGEQSHKGEQGASDAADGAACGSSVCCPSVLMTGKSKKKAACCDA